MSKECVGCKFRAGTCRMRYIEKYISTCMCKNCLVKMTCSRVCEKRNLLHFNLSSSSISHQLDIIYINDYNNSKLFEESMAKLKLLLIQEGMLKNG